MGVDEDDVCDEFTWLDALSTPPSSLWESEDDSQNHFTAGLAVAGPVIGMDVGSWESCVALFSPGQLMPSILSNDISLQETRTVVAFTENGRLVGEEAVSSLTSNPQNAIAGGYKLLSASQDELLNAGYRCIEGCDHFALSVDLFQKRYEIIPEHVVASIFDTLSGFASHNRQQRFPTVLSVPGSVAMIPEILKAVHAAAKIARIPIHRIVTSTTAASALYGYTNIREPPTDAVCGIFLDLGHAYTTVEVFQFQKGCTRSLGLATADNCCGMAIDAELVKFVTAEVLAKYKLNVSTNARARARILKECERAKRKLSTAPNTTVELPSLLNDVDVSVTLSRELVVEAVNKLKGFLSSAIQSALQQAGCTVRELRAVEVIGGNARIPAILKVIEEALNGLPLGRHLDSAHSPADGAALIGAFGSPCFECEYEVVDLLPTEATRSDVPWDMRTVLDLEEHIQHANAEHVELLNRRNSMETFIYETKSLVDNIVSIPDDERRRVIALLDDRLSWLDDSNDVSLDTVAVESIALKAAVAHASPALASYIEEETRRKAEAAEARQQAEQKQMDSTVVVEKSDIKYMTKTQRLARAKKSLGQGAVLASELAYEEALVKFNEAVEVLHHLEDHGLQDHQRTEMLSIRSLSHARAAKMYLLLEDSRLARERFTEAEESFRVLEMPERELQEELRSIGQHLDEVAPQKRRRRRRQQQDMEVEQHVQNYEPCVQGEEEYHHRRRRRRGNDDQETDEEGIEDESSHRRRRRGRRGVEEDSDDMVQHGRRGKKKPRRVFGRSNPGDTDSTS